mmetsp:Transcript_42042/g.135158  ORF Transcript_42042/g.135158 Transcript_42042/m.135158 type:complete len:313 (+) Transcript_42042:337-1275(+)
MAGRRRRHDRDGPAHLFWRVPKHDEPLPGARHRGPAAVEGAPHDVCHAAAARRVHLVRLPRRCARAAQHGGGHPGQHRDALAPRQGADGARPAADAARGPAVHRRAGRAERQGVHGQVRHAGDGQRGDLHRDGKGARLHGPRPHVDGGGAHRDESLHQRGGRLADRIPRRRPAGAPLRADGGSRPLPRRRGAARRAARRYRGWRRRAGCLPAAGGWLFCGGGPVRLRRAGGRLQEAPARLVVDDALLPPDRGADRHPGHQRAALVRQEAPLGGRALLLALAAPVRVRRHEHLCRRVRRRGQVARPRALGLAR